MIKILSIDDQRDNQIAIKGALSSFFPMAQFKFALSGVEGIAIGIDFQPDVILLDIMMPEMDGFEVCRQMKLHESLRFSPIILLSALGNKTENRIRGLELGADAIMSKPFDPGELSAQINVLIRLKRAEEKLRNENVELDKLVEEKVSQIVFQATVLENVADAVISADSDFVIKTWNEAAENTYGWAESEVIGLSYHEVLKPKYREKSREYVLSKFSKEQKYQNEVIHSHKSGAPIFIYTSVSQIMDKHGNNIGTVALNRNISKEKLAESQIANLTSRLELAVKTVELGIWEWDIHSSKLEWNDEFAKIYGIVEKAPVGFRIIFEKYIYDQDKFQSIKAIKLLLKDGEKMVKEHRVNNPKLGLRHVISKAIRLLDNEGHPTKVIGVSYDVSIRKQMEAKLFDSEERYRMLVETSNDLVWITDVEGNYIFYNQHVKDVTGYQFEKFIGQPALLLISKENHDSFSKEFDRVLMGEKRQMEVSAVFAGGVEHVLWINMAPIFKDNKVVSVATFARDMTDFRFAMEELKVALAKAKESDRLKSAFLATMSHELRTPLNAIIGFSSLLEKDMDMEDFTKFSEIIAESGQHLLSLVEEIFDITLIEAGEVKVSKKNFDISQLFGRIKEIMQNQKVLFNRDNIELHFPTIEEMMPLWIYSDKQRLEQIIVNLIKNALKFTEQGSVTFGFEKEIDEGKPMIRFYVTDTGIGIPKEKLILIFDAFRQVDDTHTRKYDGIGLGLSVAKKLTELLGGKIYVASELGIGSTFTFSIPYELDDSNESKAVVSLDEIGFNENKVLVVEDDIDSYHFLELVLLKHGAVPLWAHNGKEAVQFCDDINDISLVLMDLNMPVMDGFDATKLIKQRHPDLPIIVQTAYTLHSDNLKARESGCDDILDKPIIIHKLIKMLNKYL